MKHKMQKRPKPKIVKTYNLSVY